LVRGIVAIDGAAVDGHAQVTPYGTTLKPNSFQERITKCQAFY
jgi:hypothetical protein